MKVNNNAMLSICWNNDFYNNLIDQVCYKFEITTSTMISIIRSVITSIDTSPAEITISGTNLDIFGGLPLFSLIGIHSM